MSIPVQPRKRNYFRVQHACGLGFARKFTLKRHIEKQYPNTSTGVGDACDNCQLICHHIKNLREHQTKRGRKCRKRLKKVIFSHTKAFFVKN